MINFSSFRFLMAELIKNLKQIVDFQQKFD